MLFVSFTYVCLLSLFFLLLLCGFQNSLRSNRLSAFVIWSLLTSCCLNPTLFQFVPASWSIGSLRNDFTTVLSSLLAMFNYILLIVWCVFFSTCLWSSYLVVCMCLDERWPFRVRLDVYDHSGAFRAWLCAKGDYSLSMSYSLINVVMSGNLYFSSIDSIWLIILRFL